MTHAVKSLDLDVAEGEIVTVLGANGAGKTSLLRALQGAVRASSGSIRFDGRELAQSAPAERVRHGMALVPEGRQIFVSMTVHENLLMGGYLRRDSDWGRDVKQVYERFPNLAERRDMKASVLSGGEQQLLALARCLCTRPRLILLDEPTEGIQPSIIEEMIETLLALRQRWQLSLVVVEQNLEFITSLCDRILHIQKGRMTGELDRQALLAGEVGMGAMA